MDRALDKIHALLDGKPLHNSLLDISEALREAGYEIGPPGKPAGLPFGAARYLQLCTCDDLHGCPTCFDEAQEYVGRKVRDDKGREWEVTESDERDGFPTIGGRTYWARPHDVTLVDSAFPIKLDDEYTCRGTGPLGESYTFDDLLYEGEEVGIGRIPEDAEDRDPLPPFGIVVRKDNGLWIRALTDEEDKARTEEILGQAKGETDG